MTPQSVKCPSCGAIHDFDADGSTACSRCGTPFQVRLFAPVVLKEEEAAPAMPDDSVCAHHPAKRAEHVCAGTGAYICSLCAVHHQGEILSAAYLNTSAGKARTQVLFASTIPRPDSIVSLICICLLIPYVGCVGWLALPFLVPWSFVLLARAARLRREGDPVYARVVRPWKLWFRGIWLSFLSLVALFWLLGIIGAIASPLRH